MIHVDDVVSQFHADIQALPCTPVFFLFIFFCKFRLYDPLQDKRHTMVVFCTTPLQGKIKPRVVGTQNAGYFP